jgi:hypothetical protein
MEVVIIKISKLLQNLLGSTVSTIKNKKKDSKENTKVISEIRNNGIQDDSDSAEIDIASGLIDEYNGDTSNDFVVG